MQKSLRISLQARNQALKRAHRQTAKETKEEWRDWRRDTIRKNRVANGYVKEERANRREDWIRGPLAPNRNSGLQKDVYGSVDPTFLQNRPIPEAARAGPKKLSSAAVDSEDRHEGFQGQGNIGNIVVGDRVVVVKGHEKMKGKIGSVTEVDTESEVVKLQNINSVSALQLFHPTSGK